VWAVTSTFLQTIQTAPSFTQQATFTPPGGTPITVPIEEGSVSLASTQNTRRTCDLTVTGGSDVYQAIMAPGTILDLTMGLQYASSSELVPVFHGELTEGDQDLGAGTIALQGGDMAVRLARSKFLNAWSPSNYDRVEAIATAVRAAVPGTVVLNLSTDTGTVGKGTSWASQASPLDVIGDLTKDGGTEAFFRPDGVFVIRDLPVVDSSPVWTLSRTLTAAARERPLDSLYNAVVVTPAATDGSQKWPQQVVELTDTSHPLHKSKIGFAPYFWSSPTIVSQGEARTAASAMLSRITGATQTLNLGSVSNPALDGGDVITVLAPPLGQEPAQSFRHFIDSFSLDLPSGAMTLATRSTQVVADD
jgi:hypothetical protein